MIQASAFQLRTITHATILISILEIADTAPNRVNHQCQSQTRQNVRLLPLSRYSLLCCPQHQPISAKKELRCSTSLTRSDTSYSQQPVHKKPTVKQTMSRHSNLASRRMPLVMNIITLRTPSKTTRATIACDLNSSV